MNTITFRVVEQFPEPEYSALLDQAFSDYEPSALLSDVARQEAALRPETVQTGIENVLRIGAFRGNDLVGWTFASPEGSSLLYMVNSGVATTERRKGIYSALARLVIEHARSRGYAAIVSRHVASNNSVIIAKLKLGFFLSGFEYSEVYGPLVRLTYLPGSLRRSLYQVRSQPIRRAKPKT